jgi:hypothetical protein
MPDEKDRPLLLRRRADGKLSLMSDTWPPRHEFSKNWLLENTMSGVVSLSEDEIKVSLANANATYTIDRDLMEEEYEGEDGEAKTRTISTGYWGVLAENSVEA